ncbi:hypothetical protein MTR67_047930 [Solanum verrucosum]|uniref:DUF4283 domain-containing protein n=1 Tax=Solanum verrucosum TaxID=315347 RepID=A0AAF0ZZ28_SOLVR|nr:hypothetical protein MTR67_047930 [Solanum verrucosum]
MEDNTSHSQQVNKEVETHEKDQSEEVTKKIKKIFLSEEENERLYTPGKYSLIIKLLGKRISHQYLKTKIQQLWKPSELFPLIDLGEDFYIVKFLKEENMAHVLNHGLWFINNHFLTVQRWKPNLFKRKQPSHTLLSGLDYLNYPQNFMMEKF